jgi:hypothetical protein
MIILMSYAYECYGSVTAIPSLLAYYLHNFLNLKSGVKDMSIFPMQKSFTKIAAAMVFALVLGNVAVADPINGSIGFVGNFSTDHNSDFTHATDFSWFNAMTFGAATGDYSTVGAFTSVAFTPFSFTASGVTPLWTFSVSGTQYSFDATSVDVTTTVNSIIAEGNGIAHITGMDDTTGSWIITGNSAHGLSLTFSASTAVPDGGTTALLLGLSLVGMSLFAGRRRLARC